MKIVIRNPVGIVLDELLTPDYRSCMLCLGDEV